LTADLADLLAPDRCALVLVDLQNDYCHPEGALAARGADVHAAATAAAATAVALDAARAAGVPCIHLRTEHSLWTDTPAWVMRGSTGDVLDVPETPVALAGTWGAEPFVVEAGPDDRVITKHRYSGFAYTSLELSLRARCRETIVLAGVTSDVCLRATALDALARGFLPVLMSDCSASTTPRRHADAMEQFAGSLGPVLDSSTVRAAWRQVSEPHMSQA
jgi:ureidoacrylate peracid hydrolase